MGDFPSNSASLFRLQIFSRKHLSNFAMYITNVNVENNVEKTKRRFCKNIKVKDQYLPPWSFLRNYFHGRFYYWNTTACTHAINLRKVCFQTNGKFRFWDLPFCYITRLSISYIKLFLCLHCLKKVLLRIISSKCN